MDLSTLIIIVPIVISAVSLFISFFAHREAAREPDIILIIEEEKEVEVHIEPRFSGIINYEEAYLIVPFVFLNRGSKGGAVMDIQPEITNLPLLNRLRSIDHNFKDGSGKPIDPRFFLPSIEGRESLSGTLEFCIRFDAPSVIHIPTSEYPSIRQVFKDVNNILKFRFDYKTVCSNGKLVPKSKEIKLLLRYE